MTAAFTVLSDQRISASVGILFLYYWNIFESGSPLDLDNG